MRRIVAFAACSGLLGAACGHDEGPVRAPLSATEPPTGADEGKGLSCRCDVLDFESQDAPKSRCRLLLNADGSGSLVGETTSPKFTAKLTPIPGKKRAVDYVFEGAFEFACQSEWCKPSTLQVLQVKELDYRVTVERSEDGPPSRVLWLTCS